MKTGLHLLVSIVTVALAAPASAEVKDTRDNGFTIEATVLAEASPASTYRALVNVAMWWDPAHTWSGSARSLTLDPKAGGCFCEKLANGGSVQHARVIFAQPGKLLRLEGGLGPMQDMAVTGILSFTLEPDGKGTRIRMSYRVAGMLTMPAAQLAPGVDQVMGIQLGRLQTLIAGGPAGH
jgi:uncharacterized protein YndB with AHSA1/START domain